MKYKFEKIDDDITKLSYKDKEFEIKRDVELTSKMQSVYMKARTKMMVDLSKQRITKEDLTIEKSNCWKKELVHLMHDFYIPNRVIDRIILSVEHRIKPNTSCNEAYQRGWVLFKEYLLKQ